MKPGSELGKCIRGGEVRLPLVTYLVADSNRFYWEEKQQSSPWVKAGQRLSPIHPGNKRAVVWLLCPTLPMCTLALLRWWCGRQAGRRGRHQILFPTKHWGDRLARLLRTEESSRILCGVSSPRIPRRMLRDRSAKNRCFMAGSQHMHRNLEVRCWLYSSKKWSTKNKPLVSYVAIFHILRMLWI